MLSLKQLQVLILLKQYGFASVEGCRELTGKNDIATLLRLKYVSKNNNLISLLKKGRELVEDTEELITVGGNLVAKQKVAKMADIAGILWLNGIPSINRLPEENENVFIPSNIWRKFRTCIVSTSRFLGVVHYNNRKIVIYDIGGGIFAWQAYAEYSHFFRSYGTHETKANAMLIVCDNGIGLEVAERAIRHSLWQRKTLIKNYGSYENPKPHKYSRAEITVRSDYEAALFCERQDMMETLNTWNGTTGYRYEEDSVNFTRTIDNRHNDLLLYVQAIPEANTMHPRWRYYIHAPLKYAVLLQKFKTELKVNR